MTLEQFNKLPKENREAILAKIPECPDSKAFPFTEKELASCFDCSDFHGAEIERRARWRVQWLTEYLTEA